jgi:hypothetical protein
MTGIISRKKDGQPIKLKNGYCPTCHGDVFKWVRSDAVVWKIAKGTNIGEATIDFVNPAAAEKWHPSNLKKRFIIEPIGPIDGKW